LEWESSGVGSPFQWKTSTQGNAQKRLILPMEWRSSRPSSSFLAAQRYKSAT
jgi:hypothetical protein